MYHVGTITARIRTEFNIPDSAQCRLWKRNMTNTYKPLTRADEANTYKLLTRVDEANTYKLLTRADEAVQEAGLSSGQVSEIEVVNFVTAVTCVSNHTASDA